VIQRFKSRLPLRSRARGKRRSFTTLDCRESTTAAGGNRLDWMLALQVDGQRWIEAGV
jgi:hypothetical protein